jgi:hypothetical protein
MVMQELIQILVLVVEVVVVIHSVVVAIHSVVVVIHLVEVTVPFIFTQVVVDNLKSIRKNYLMPFLVVADVDHVDQDEGVIYKCT